MEREFSRSCRKNLPFSSSCTDNRCLRRDKSWRSWCSNSDMKQSVHWRNAVEAKRGLCAWELRLDVEGLLHCTFRVLSEEEIQWEKRE